MAKIVRFHEIGGEKSAQQQQASPAVLKIEAKKDDKYVQGDNR